MTLSCYSSLTLGILVTRFVYGVYWRGHWGKMWNFVHYLSKGVLLDSRQLGNITLSIILEQNIFMQQENLKTKDVTTFETTFPLTPLSFQDIATNNHRDFIPQICLLFFYKSWMMPSQKMWAAYGSKFFQQCNWLCNCFSNLDIVLVCNNEINTRYNLDI